MVVFTIAKVLPKYFFFYDCSYFTFILPAINGRPKQDGATEFYPTLEGSDRLGGINRGLISGRNSFWLL